MTLVSENIIMISLQETHLRGPVFMERSAAVQNKEP